MFYARTLAAPGLGASLAMAATRHASAVHCGEKKEEKLSKLRTREFPLDYHHHGKSKVRVLKVRHGSGGTHKISEYSVNTTLFSPRYADCFVKEDNSDLVATDTQKNTVYHMAKVSKYPNVSNLTAVCRLRLSSVIEFVSINAFDYLDHRRGDPRAVRHRYRTALFEDVPHSHRSHGRSQGSSLGARPGGWQGAQPRLPEEPA